MLRRVLQQEWNHLDYTISTSTSIIIRNYFSSQKRKIHVQDMKDDTYEGNCEDQEEEFPYMDVPRLGRKQERKPYVTSMKVLIRRAKEEKMLQKDNPCRVLEEAPKNGLLVPELIDIARQVYFARESLLHGLSLLINRHADAIFIHRCRYCREVHIGKMGHKIKTCEGPKGASRNATHIWRKGGIRDIVYFPKCYHLYDRVMHPRVGHKERFEVQRLPAIVELCIQAGLDLEDYPVKRRTKPIYSIEGRIVDFELKQDDEPNVETRTNLSYSSSTTTNTGHGFMLDGQETMSDMGKKTLQSWLEMRSGIEKIMKKYGALTCGYCNAIHVGPKGHKVRRCKATGHQYRDGLHAWQEATIDDLVGPNYVWHAANPHGPSLDNELKRYYGKAPAVVELCVQSGAPVPREYERMMRLDVVAPRLDEYDLVA